jgi:glycosyltransferase involved in cell wall biosynthesis
LKIYEAMAMEKPVVSTTVGAEGLPINNGQELLLADTPAAFAEAVVSLLSMPDFAHEIGARAALAVRRQFGWEQVTARFAELCSLTTDLARLGANSEASARVADIQKMANRSIS